MSPCIFVLSSSVSYRQSPITLLDRVRHVIGRAVVLKVKRWSASMLLLLLLHASHVLSPALLLEILIAHVEQRIGARRDRIEAVVRHVRSFEVASEIEIVRTSVGHRTIGSVEERLRGKKEVRRIAQRLKALLLARIERLLKHAADLITLATEDLERTLPNKMTGCVHHLDVRRRCARSFALMVLW